MVISISLLQLCSEKCCSSTVAHEVIHASSLLMNAFRGSPFLPQSWYYHLLPAACRYLIQTGVFWAWHNFQCFVDIINKTLKVWNFFETDIRLYIYKKQQSLLVWAVKVFVPYSLEYRPLQIFAICFYLGFTQRPNFFWNWGIIYASTMLYYLWVYWAVEENVAHHAFLCHEVKWVTATTKHIQVNTPSYL